MNGSERHVRGVPNERAMKNINNSGILLREIMKLTDIRIRVAEDLI